MEIGETHKVVQMELEENVSTIVFGRNKFHEDLLRDHGPAVCLLCRGNDIVPS